MTYHWRRSLAKCKRNQQLRGDQQEMNTEFSLCFSFDSEECLLNSCTRTSKLHCWQLRQSIANSSSKQSQLEPQGWQQYCLDQNNSYSCLLCLHAVSNGEINSLSLCSFHVTDSALYLVLMLDQLLLTKSHFHKSLCSLNPISPPKRYMPVW